MKKSFCFVILYATISSCLTSTNKPFNSDIKLDTKFPSIKLDSVSFIDEDLILNFTDSSIYFNPIVAAQIGNYTTYELKLLEEYSYDSILFNFNTPLRDDKIVGIKFSSTDLLKYQEKFNNNEFKKFTRKLFELNYKSHNLYYKDATTLLDRLNSFFAREIHFLYEGNIDAQELFFGYDSFIIFNNYFNECKKYEESEVTYFVNQLKTDTLFVKSEIKQKLFNLINEYCK